MELNITGPATDNQREMITRAVDFFLDLLMTRKLKQSLYIDLELAKRLEDREGVCGDATWEDDNCRPKEFSVRVHWDGKKRFRKNTGNYCT